MHDVQVAGGLAATAIAGGAALCAYGGLSDQSQLFGATLVAPADPHQLALTFDDGPNPAATPKLLEILARHQVRATFFLIGRYALREPGLVHEIVAAGHTIGSHTMHHKWLPRHSSRVIREEIISCKRVLEDSLGTRVTLFRAPHGARSPAVFRVAKEEQLTVCQWNLMVGDWKLKASSDLYRRLLRGIVANQRAMRGTCIVLHDGSQHTAAADRSATIAAVDLLLDSLPRTVQLVCPPDWD